MYCIWKSSIVHSDGLNWLDGNGNAHFSAIGRSVFHCTDSCTFSHLYRLIEIRHTRKLALYSVKYNCLVILLFIDIIIIVKSTDHRSSVTHIWIHSGSESRNIQNIWKFLSIISSLLSTHLQGGDKRISWQFKPD